MLRFQRPALQGEDSRSLMLQSKSNITDDPYPKPYQLLKNDTLVKNVIPNPSTSIFWGGSFSTQNFQTCLKVFCIKYLSLEYIHNMIPTNHSLGFTIHRLIFFRLLNLY